MIKVQQTNESDPLAFTVTVTEGSGKTTHQVTLSQGTYQKLTGAKVSASDCVQAAFQFLLEREPKEAILRQFDITVISHYFPNFERELPRYLERL
ncbi:hypothetical protein [Nitrosococcus wardiae]|uniref:Uncharacterized protein n=1 Tax=Nitrosococcus wardiae TaxID=1814290 RepID=A0A4P7BXU9_9GAMM|nr:hypothetical protein [Nitrosococcus wardiae]QBQ54851.1 hypothetical protein E3U44_10260 [Nitrosococcus wardiae]